MSKRSHVVLPLALSFSAELLATEAQSPELFSLGEVNVTATKIEDSEQNTARPMSVIQMSEPQNKNVQSVADALDSQSNITQSGGPRSSVKSVNIRGLGGNKVLQTIDGAPQAFQSGHRASYFLDPALIKRVEVVKGPASSIYGSGAIGGVVAQETIDPEDLLAGDRKQGGFVKLANNANNQQQDVVAGLGLRSGDLDWLLSGYYKDGDDMTLGNGDTLESSAERSKGVLVKQNWFVADSQSLGLSYRNEQLAGQVPSNGSAAINGTSVFNLQRDQVNQAANIDYDWVNKDGSNTFNAKAYWDSIAIDESRISDNRADKTEQDSVGLSLDNVTGFNGFTLLTGAETKETHFDGERSGVAGTRPIVPGAVTTTSGLYAQIVAPLYGSSASARGDGISLELGARYDDFSSEAKNLNQSNSDDDFSGSAALVWRQSEQLTVALRYDQAFRAPSAEELYTTGAHFCMGPGFCNTFVATPDLDPETAENKELLVKWSDTQWLGADRVGVSASVFRNDVDNFISQIVEPPSFGMGPPNAGTTYNTNVDKAQLNGFELEASYLLAGVEGRIAYGQVRGKDQKTGEDLTNIPADSITAQLSNQFSSSAQLGMRVIHTQDQDKTRYSANTTQLVYDDYTTLDVYGSWAPKALGNITLDMSLNNLTDRYYRKTWSQLDAVGREVILAATYTF
ncbi:hypothetical protein A3742_08160 [Oleiphilus sp. HI0071]|uniref:TonB-dependent hemoglobin/transferrin/lactoferrin family receptor n=4 Tax=unclassified Oleiphilus TaxID=2631174 RepID=UPI0007C275DD|nr:TonB-dependent hemoglobin/transferrin/lactoferrin family receptor [Oleiphilus sp. HI0079]KZY72575.1 hypothetical protein A3737_10735 [Oleiphilus sp. HI0065]KZY82845.1 hypothetical protein A3742_08160 [Oleiphilus sp. HI0071]KZZ04842.1 hypothetical protein A3744_09210 [Oleiphilus sp. HI0073]KZZ49151.1 hypothetical protein A3760_02865 [Oleiphilus sp. HI0122]KZZ81268.1 hypothetical protein A3767_08315 [Oleiphilus sp. HI0133]